MRKLFVYIQYPRTIFADILYSQSKNEKVKDKTIQQLINEDMPRYILKHANIRKMDVHALNHLLISNPIFRNVFYFRIQQSKKLQSSLLKAISMLLVKPLHNIEIGVNDGGYIDGGLRIVHTAGCTIAPHVCGKNLSVYQGVTIGASSKKDANGCCTPTIGNHVTVMANSIVGGA